MCKVSVIMSVYNTNKEWLAEAIESILNQTFDDFEFIIILDAPTDGCDKVVKKYEKKDSRIIVIENEENIGLTRSLNKGLSIAKGKYIARMDADDISLLNRFELQYNYMENHPEVVVVGSRVFSGDLTTAAQYEWTEQEDIFRIRMLFYNVGVPHPTAFIRRYILVNNKIGYTETIKKSQDYKLWVDLMKYGRIIILPDVLLMYRIHDKQISAEKNSQMSFAHRVALEQARYLLGEMTTIEEEIHCSMNNVEIPNEDVYGIHTYLKRLEHENLKKKIYNNSAFRTELNYMWCRKALRRMVLMKKFDMLLNSRSLHLFDIKVISCFWNTYREKKMYIKAIKKIKN